MDHTMIGLKRKLNLENIIFSIIFSDESRLKLLNFLNPILSCEKLSGVPKLIVGQFCRGESVPIETLQTDGHSKPFNIQEIFKS